MPRWRCGECEEVVTDRQMLTAPNPFDETDTICGCPICKRVGLFERLCDVDQCNNLPDLSTLQMVDLVFTMQCRAHKGK